MEKGKKEERLIFASRELSLCKQSWNEARGEEALETKR